MQGLKVLDTSVESFTLGAWQALGTAWKGGANLVHKYVIIVAIFLDVVATYWLHSLENLKGCLIGAKGQYRGT